MRKHILTHQTKPTKRRRQKKSEEQKETVLMSMVKSLKKARTDNITEKPPSESDLPRPDVPRNIEEPTLMDALKNTENEEDDSF